MRLYDRYINGETEAVYADIATLGAEAFLPENLKEIEKVLEETFHRVSYNLETIYAGLKKIDYVFWKCNEGFETALIKPPSDTEKLLGQLEETVSPVGCLPLSLKMFFKIVGSCNFVWDYRHDENIMWEMSDPIQISPLIWCLEEVSDEYWLEEAREYLNDDDFGYASLTLSADALHKDNISGGPPYTIRLTSAPSIDGIFDGSAEETFIAYLRNCFDHCGFPGNSDFKNHESFRAFFREVKPKLKKI